MTPADTPAALAALLNDFEFAVQNETRKEERDANHEAIARASDKVDAARAKITEAFAALLAAARQGEEDTARLDWMQARCDELSTPEYPRVWDVMPSGDVTNYTPFHFTPSEQDTDVRVAIDAARAASQPEEVSRG